MDKRIAALTATSALLATGLLYQSYRLEKTSQTLRAEKARPYWPARPAPIGLESEPTQKFKPTVRKTIPEVFWGEFAEDVHDCGTDQSTIITERKIMVSEDDRQDVQSVKWKAPQILEISGLRNDFIKTLFSLNLSNDGNEITFIYTNMKRLYQRCSARAHDDPDELASLNTFGGNTGDDLVMNIDENLDLAE